MAFTLDYSTSTGKVRLLISDIDATNPIFADAAIDAFIAMARGGQVKRAAALALRTLAANETLVQKRIKTLDLSTDGPAEAEALRKLANDLEDQANEDEATEDGGSFDWAEMVTNPATFDERLFKERQRGLGY